MKRNYRLTKAGALAALFGVVAGAAAQHPGHSAHPLMHGQKLHLQVQLLSVDPAGRSLGEANRETTGGPGKTIDVPLKMVTTEAAQTLDQVIALPAPRKALTVRRYLPKSVIEQEVHPDESGMGPSAVELSIAGPKQSFRRWLLADDPERNRLTSYIAAWRFMAVRSKDDRNALWRQFETEFTRPPELVVRGAGGLEEERITAVIGQTHELRDKQGKITVKKFHPDCGMDRTTGEATNQSDRRRNPAVLIEVEASGIKESRWVFAKFPSFAPAQGHSVPYQVTLDCAVEPAEGLPDFAIVAIGEKIEVWTRTKGATETRSIPVGEKTDVPGTSYQFSIEKILPSAIMKETYRKDEKGKAAIEVEYMRSDGKADQLWVELGHTRSVSTSDGQIMVSLQVRDEAQKANSPGAHP